MNENELIKKILNYDSSRVLEVKALINAGKSIDEIHDAYFPKQVRKQDKYFYHAGAQQKYYNSLDIQDKFNYNWNDLDVVIKFTLGEQLTDSELNYMEQCYPQWRK